MASGTTPSWSVPRSQAYHQVRPMHACGLAIVWISTMISIRISDKGFWWGRRLIDKFVLCSTLQIAKHMLGSLPVSWSRVGVDSGKHSGSIGNVWPCGDCKIHQRANNRDVGVLLHLRSLCIVLRTHASGCLSARIERSGDRLWNRLDHAPGWDWRWTCENVT